MKPIRLSVMLLNKNYKSILLFESFFKLSVLFVFSPIIKLLLKIALNFAGYKYLTTENLSSFLLNPITLCFILLIIMVSALIMLIEVCAIIHGLDSSYCDRGISAINLLEKGIQSALRVFQKGNWFLILFLAIIIPFTGLLSVSNYLFEVKIPTFIMKYIDDQWILSIIHGIIMIVFSIVIIRWLFSFHYYALENRNYKEAREKSKELIKGKGIKSMLHLIKWETLISFGIVIILLLIMFILVLSGITFINHKIILIPVFSALSVIIYVIRNCLFTPLLFAYISALFYSTKSEKGEVFGREYDSDLPVLRTKRKHRILPLFLIAVIINSVYLSLYSTGKMDLNANLAKEVQVTAHRGDSMNAPENTMAAFQKAMDCSADFIELDVAQLKDGTIVVMHDSNFKRIAGLNKSVWEVEFEEVKDLDIGSWFSPEYKDMRLSTLEEVIHLAQHKVKLNIEIKPTGNELDFAKSVAKIIEKNNFANQCVVSSLDYHSITEIKQYNPEIKTAYVMAVAFGNLEELQYADAFNIEESAVTETLIKSVHNMGKEINVWTVNSEEVMQSMLELGVDGIITDHIALANEVTASIITVDIPDDKFSAYMKDLLWD